MIEYLAGIIDGEGCITTDAGGYLIIRVEMVHEGPPRLLQEHFGGALFQHKEKKYWCWDVRAGQCEKALKAIFPYSIVKRKEVALGILWLETMVGSGHPLDHAQVTTRAKIATLLRQLKRSSR